MNLRNRKILSIDEEQKNNNERVISKKRSKVEDEKKKERLVVQKRKKIDEDEKKREILIAKKRQKIEEEHHKYEMLIAKKRSKIEEEHNKYEMVIARKRKLFEEKQKKNELVICKRRNQIEKKNEMVVAENIDDHPPCSNLPEDLIIHSILKRLPARHLATYSRVSKSWYNSICNDKPFASSHFFQNKNKLSLVFHLLNVWENNSGGNSYFFKVTEQEDKCLKIKCLQAVGYPNTRELVGYCNGLACLKSMSDEGRIIVINPTRDELLSLSALDPPGGGYIHLCHGFGFDSLSGEYKTVIVFTSTTNEEFVCMVFTLGTYSWRKITTTAAEMLASLFPATLMVTRVLRDFCRSAILCGGDLYWRVTNRVVEDDTLLNDDHNGFRNNNNKIEMLLSFNLHDEKIQFVRLPDECTTNEDQYLVVDNLLEFRGYPCVARSEKITMNDSERHLHHCNDHSNFCSCCCKVHLHILKDKVKQVWVKEETFDVQIKEESSQTTSFCSYNNTTASIPPARMLCLSDQVLLYWFDGNCLIIYDLQMKHLKVVRSSVSHPGIFKAKMSDLDRSIIIDNDDSNYCVDMDYQLHAQVENILSLKTFIPGGEITQFDCSDDFLQAIKNKCPAGWVITGNELRKYYTFS